MLNTHKLDVKVTNNLAKTRLNLLFLPILLLFVIAFILFKEDAFSTSAYIKIQEDLFFSLNSNLSKFPNLQFNLTQLGDALIFFSLLVAFIIYTPKLWGALFTSGIISGILSISLKKLFAVPRPARVFDNDSFTIIGKTLSAHTSLPSGHSIATFAIITVLIFAFMPKNFKYKIGWFFFMLLLGLFISFSRVGVGAHYPLDVIIGSIIGYIAAVLGIFVNNKVSWWNWIKNKKYYPIFMLFFIICMFVIVKKIVINNLFVFYLALLSLVATLYLMINIYVKKRH